MARAKIALLYVGGSIGMKMNRKTGRIEPIESLSEIHRFLPELQREVALNFVTLGNVGSSDVTPDHWVEIARTIERLYDDHEGFVVVHGTNTMSYTACALSFALQGLSKPVILTGALLPINDMGSDGRTNLVYAIRAAQLDLAEVAVVLGPRVLRGCRAKKVDQSIDHTFDSPKFPPVAEFNVEVKLHPWRIVRRKRTLDCRTEFDPHVVLVTLHPGLQDAYFEAVLASKPHGIVLRTYGPGMLSDRVIPWLKQASAQGIPIVITSQLIRGSVDLQRYRKQLTLERIGVISGKNMTFECAIVKLMWALGQTDKPARLQEIMEKSLVGELDE
jgi:L-asparaginase